MKALAGFLRPSAGKLALFAVMAGVTNFVALQGEIFDSQRLFGCPLGYYPKGLAIFTMGPPPPPLTFSAVNLVLDLVFWYALACGLAALAKSVRDI